MKKILVSECLYGGRVVRYDGGEVPCEDPVFLRWKAEGRLVPVCPEVAGGLPTPRPDAQRAGDRVVNCAGGDVTDAFAKGAETALALAKAEDVCCCILKESSPSCGAHEIYDGTFEGRKVEGQGLTAEKLRAAGYAVFSENEIADAATYIID
jgi:uncharacterized protein YbbK (DUF523 family)